VLLRVSTDLVDTNTLAKLILHEKVCGYLSFEGEVGSTFTPGNAKKPKRSTRKHSLRALHLSSSSAFLVYHQNTFTSYPNLASYLTTTATAAEATTSLSGSDQDVRIY
jgi:hypothetical protein